MIHFQQLLQVLPSNIEQMAINCNAFQRARKIKSPLELFKLLMLYCGLDLSLEHALENSLKLIPQSATKP